MNDEQLQDIFNVTTETIRRLTDFLELLSQRMVALDKRLQEVERLLNVRQPEERGK